MGIAQVARMTMRYTLTKAHVEQTGFKMREGLDQLADLWFSPLPDKAALRTYRPQRCGAGCRSRRHGRAGAHRARQSGQGQVQRDE
jgi:hypothetical protein